MRSLCYRFNIVLRGPQCHRDGDEIVQETIKRNDQGITPSQTVGPFFKYGLTPGGNYGLGRRLHQTTWSPRMPRANGFALRAGYSTANGQAGARRHDGNLGRPRAGPLCRSPQDSGACQCGFAARPLRHRRQWEYAFDNHKPGQVPDPRPSRRRRISWLAIFGAGMLLILHAIYFAARPPIRPNPVTALVPADRRGTPDRGT